jgi:hypothetical protein
MATKIDITAADIDEMFAQMAKEGIHYDCPLPASEGDGLFDGVGVTLKHTSHIVWQYFHLLRSDFYRLLREAGLLDQLQLRVLKTHVNNDYRKALCGAFTTNPYLKHLYWERTPVPCQPMPAAVAAELERATPYTQVTPNVVFVRQYRVNREGSGWYTLRCNRLRGNAILLCEGDARDVTFSAYKKAKRANLDDVVHPKKKDWTTCSTGLMSALVIPGPMLRWSQMRTDPVHTRNDGLKLAECWRVEYILCHVVPYEM